MKGTYTVRVHFVQLEKYFRPSRCTNLCKYTMYIVPIYVNNTKSKRISILVISIHSISTWGSCLKLFCRIHDKLTV